MTEFQLSGLRADNPLAFLAALGVLRTAAAIHGANAVRLRWHAPADAWTPVLRIDGDLGDAGKPDGGTPEDRLVSRLHERLRTTSGQQAFAIGDDLTLSQAAFRSASIGAARAASAEDRDFADFIAAFGCDAVETIENGKRSGKMADTAFRTMSGAGHQHFLGFMRTIAADCTVDHLHRSLFSPWRYDDPLESHTMRWDPVDDVRYALRWRDSSGDPERKRAGTMWGGNRLAIEALPLLPTMPVEGGQLATVGFTYSRAEGTAWTWPVWDAWCSVDTVRSLLASELLQAPQPPRAELSPLGIVEVFRCQRIRQGKYRNLTPARAV